MRAGRVAAKSGRSMSFAARTRMFAPGLLAGGGLVARKVVTYGAVAATAYVVASHPGVLHGMMAEVAKGVGIPPFVLQFFGWFLLLLLLSYPLFWVFQVLVRPIIWGLAGLAKLLGTMAEHLRYQRA